MAPLRSHTISSRSASLPSTFSTVALVLCALCTLLIGCDSTPRAKPPAPKPIANTAPLPSYLELIASYNSRIALTDRLTSQVAVIIESDKPSGGRARDQLEGNLSVIRPLNIALRLDKIGQTVAYLGSNNFAYWWFDLSGDEPIAISGTHRAATPQDAADFGLPVHPLEFIELLGLLTLPEERPPNSTMQWSKDGTSIELTLPSRWGTRRFTLDPITAEPSRIELLDPKGALAVGAVLTRFRPAYIEGQPGVSNDIAERIELSIPGSSTKVTLSLAEAKIPLKIRSRAFEMSQLVEAYQIKRFIDHDTAKRERQKATP